MTAFGQDNQNDGIRFRCASVVKWFFAVVWFAQGTAREILRPAEERGASG